MVPLNLFFYFFFKKKTLLENKEPLMEVNDDLIE